MNYKRYLNSSKIFGTPKTKVRIKSLLNFLKYSCLQVNIEDAETDPQESA